MLLYNAHKKQQGFTLVEMLVVVIIVSILAAISIPNLLGLFNQTRTKDALTQVEGALKEAQRQAIRRGQSCTVTINTTAKTVSGANSCVLSTRQLQNQVSIDVDDAFTGNQVSFSFKGNVATGGTIVVFDPQNADSRKCVFISSGLGIIRTGLYNSSTALPSTASATVAENACTTN